MAENEENISENLEEGVIKKPGYNDKEDGVKSKREKSDLPSASAKNSIFERHICPKAVKGFYIINIVISIFLACVGILLIVLTFLSLWSFCKNFSEEKAITEILKILDKLLIASTIIIISFNLMNLFKKVDEVAINMGFIDNSTLQMIVITLSIVFLTKVMEDDVEVFKKGIGIGSIILAISFYLYISSRNKPSSKN